MAPLVYGAKKLRIFSAVSLYFWLDKAN